MWKDRFLKQRTSEVEKRFPSKKANLHVCCCESIVVYGERWEDSCGLNWSTIAFYPRVVWLGWRGVVVVKWWFRDDKAGNGTCVWQALHGLSGRSSVTEKKVYRKITSIGCFSASFGNSKEARGITRCEIVDPFTRARQIRATLGRSCIGTPSIA